MYSIFVSINVKPEHVDGFRKASLAEAKGTISGEPGVFQFHMLDDKDNPNRFYFFEIFEDEAAIDAHWQTENFRTWWDRIQPMLEGPPERLATMRTIFPSTEGLRKQKPGLSNW